MPVPTEAPIARGVLLIADISGYTMFLEVRDGGVHLSMGAARPSGPRLERTVRPSVLPKLMEGVEAALVQFRDRIEGEFTSSEG